MTRDLGDVVAPLLDHAFVTIGRASTPPHVWRSALRLLDVGHGQYPLHPLGLEDLANSLQELAFLRELTLAPAWGWGQGVQLALGVGQSVVPSFCLLLSMSRGVDHQHPLLPWPLAMRFFHVAGPCELVPLGHQHLLTFVVGPHHGLSLASLGFGDALADPRRHLLGRRAGEGEGRQGKMPLARQGRTDGSRAHLAVTDKESSPLVQPLLEAVDDRDVSAVVGLVTREHIRCQRHPQRV